MCEKNLEDRTIILEKLVYKLLNACFGEPIAGCSNMNEVIMNDDLLAPKMHTPEWDSYQEAFEAELATLENELNLPAELRAFE